MAQDSRVATLQHGSNFRAYYGTDAFISANNDAADGDVITLTAGVFNCPQNVTKAITIRGEGMNKTILSNGDFGSFSIPVDSSFPLCLEGLTLCVNSYSRDYFPITSTGGSATVILSKCASQRACWFNNCSAIIIDSEIQRVARGQGNSSITCINSIMTSLEGSTFDVQNCVITGTANVSNSIIKNSIVFGVTALNGTNESSHCLVKEGSSGFANSWYIKAEQPEPDPWGENPTYTLFDELFTANYHLTAEASQNYIGTDGTEVGIYGGAYPYDITPDYPLVKNIEVKGIHENGKLNVKINVE